LMSRTVAEATDNAVPRLVKPPQQVVRRTAEPDRPVTSVAVARAGKAGAVSAVVSKSENDPPLPLVMSIQTELVRVGCLAGTADGHWSGQTRTAMRAFNTSVRVDLPTDRPDYILLTLLQGHNAKACSRSCESSAGGGGSCVDESIQARTVAPNAPALASSRETVTKSTLLSTWTTTAARDLAIGIEDPRNSAGDTRPMFRPVGQRQPITRRQEDTTLAARGGTSVAPRSGDVLPGRMAIGATPPPTAPLVSVASPPDAASRPVASSGSSRPARVRATRYRRASVRAVFQNMSRTAP
jgi:peptidoglycan hydrolase-like protein with peptidoglycan-binding domain